MKDNATNYVKISYYSKCKDGTVLSATNKCDGIKVGDIIEFQAEIVVVQCPENPNEWNQVIQIYPVGIDESLVIDLEMLCDCSCEKPGHPTYQVYSPKCNFHGTYKCGICECDPEFYGRTCECSM